MVRPWKKIQPSRAGPFIMAIESESEFSIGDTLTDDNTSGSSSIMVDRIRKLGDFRAYYGSSSGAADRLDYLAVEAVLSEPLPDRYPAIRGLIQGFFMGFAENALTLPVNPHESRAISRAFL
jgi:hypothetical protein